MHRMLIFPITAAFLLAAKLHNAIYHVTRFTSLSNVCCMEYKIDCPCYLHPFPKKKYPQLWINFEVQHPNVLYMIHAHIFTNQLSAVKQVLANTYRSPLSEWKIAIKKNWEWE